MTKEQIKEHHEKELLQVESNLYKLNERRKELLVILMTLQVQQEEKKQE